jgi:hypothetical protein
MRGKEQRWKDLGSLHLAQYKAPDAKTTKERLARDMIANWQGQKCWAGDSPGPPASASKVHTYHGEFGKHRLIQSLDQCIEGSDSRRPMAVRQSKQLVRDITKKKHAKRIF